MIRAGVAADGRLYYDGCLRDGDVYIQRFWRPEESPVRACGDDCTADHPDGARCVVPHEALIAERAQVVAEAALEDLCARKLAKLQRRAALMRAGLTSKDERVQAVEAEVTEITGKIAAAIATPAPADIAPSPPQ